MYIQIYICIYICIFILNQSMQIQVSRLSCGTGFVVSSNEMVTPHSCCCWCCCTNAPRAQFSQTHDGGVSIITEQQRCSATTPSIHDGGRSQHICLSEDEHMFWNPSIGIRIRCICMHIYIHIYIYIHMHIYIYLYI